jgi:hypothetical protein
MLVSTSSRLCLFVLVRALPWLFMLGSTISALRHPLALAL